ncbi:MAG: CoA pyrophosphatase [Acidimicrobiales bacterium]|jgi:8-oxo-dGTP pyrophosphatase MutT (NUDIX family)
MSNANRPARFDGFEYPQVIPEPDDVIAGAPAPWSTLDEGSRRGFTLAHVVERLRAGERHLDDWPIPGDPQEMEAVMDATSRPIVNRAAVLLALFEEDGETYVVLTRRATTLRSHRGEIALPGGRADGDETPVETALREAHEEVGIEPASVTPIGWLSPIVTFASGSALWPVIGVLGERPNLITDPAEVDRAFSVTLKDLVAEGAFLEERWRRAVRRPGADEDGYFPIYFFAVPGDVIWGATARVLTELLCVVTGVAWPDAQRVWA